MRHLAVPCLQSCRSFYAGAEVRLDLGSPIRWYRIGYKRTAFRGIVHSEVIVNVPGVRPCHARLGGHDGWVSVKHAQIRFDESEGSYHALDMKSKNGTRINSRAIDGDTRLEDGDVIRIGESTITFYDRDFSDKQDAFQHHKKAGERRRSTATRRV